ncbi:hypothetical protein GDO78_004108 [Eleutherodactylus coqui]|uniref:Uncharacterized protein n=1 Tax=Eleutherodactylus coqui TaxID=57060 RepID=A0A8J6JXH1_ELECQ|nr:hypothetical protein GDO78_004108 [Eleutherodactylus coqui]
MGQHYPCALLVRKDILEGGCLLETSPPLVRVKSHCSPWLPSWRTIMNGYRGMGNREYRGPGVCWTYWFCNMQRVMCHKWHMVDVISLGCRQLGYIGLLIRQTASVLESVPGIQCQ